jgi:polyhydroxyalkanoate synthase
MAEAPPGTTLPPIDLPTLQLWTRNIGQAQQMMLQFWAEQVGEDDSVVETAAARAGAATGTFLPDFNQVAAAWSTQSSKMANRQIEFWNQSLDLWHHFLDPEASAKGPAVAAAVDRDPRIDAEAWRAQPFFDLIRQSYVLVADHLMKGIDELEGLDDSQRNRLHFFAQQMVDALSPANFFATNPEVIALTLETNGENLLRGLSHMLDDIGRGQITQGDPNAFEIGRNIAATPGKVVYETRLFQIIQYQPSTATVARTPVLFFPPWINRFYILDLSPKKSLIKWAVDQGLSLFMVSWKSADETLADVTFDDYVLAQNEAIDVVRDLLDVKKVHTVGYCVAGTTLAQTLAWLSAKGEADKVASATFFTAQVDFSQAGDLNLFVDDQQLQLVDALAGDKGYLDGRYMAATFNLLRGRDLIWNYVVNNYLLGKDYAPFDLLHWNSDVTNLPAKWHRQYLERLYRDNLLVKPGGISIAGTPIDLRKVATPAYVQAGRDDHIAPAHSVWKITEHFTGPIRFLLAGSGHIAGVVNPADSGKYQYWTNESPADTLEAFMEGATETKGSWWPDWAAWLRDQDSKTVPATGARIPGGGKLPAIEDAPGRYVRTR